MFLFSPLPLFAQQKSSGFTAYQILSQSFLSHHFLMVLSDER